MLLRDAGGSGDGPDQGQHFTGSSGSTFSGRPTGFFLNRGLDHLAVPARFTRLNLPRRRAEPQQGEFDHSERDHAPPDGRGVHGQGRVRERAEAGDWRHESGLRHLGARHSRVWVVRSARRGAQQQTPRTFTLRLFTIHHHRHLHAELLREAVDFE